MYLGGAERERERWVCAKPEYTRKVKGMERRTTDKRANCGRIRK
jgi:hypothetical protein